MLTDEVGEKALKVSLITTSNLMIIKSTCYVFVEDVDRIYKRALEFGASSINEPADQFFGHRQGAVKDHQGNVWWIAKFLRKVSQDELSKHTSD